MPKFGPAGNAESFAKMGYKNSLDVPDYIVEMGLDCYEYQCGRGVNRKRGFASRSMRRIIFQCPLLRRKSALIRLITF